LAFAARGNFDEAVVHYREALEIMPDLAMAHFNLGFALAERGQVKEALDHYRKELRSANARNDQRLVDLIRDKMRSLGAGE
jgi:tetratricopeptide (TPR) repeat protein